MRKINPSAVVEVDLSDDETVPSKYNQHSNKNNYDKEVVPSKYNEHSNRKNYSDETVPSKPNQHSKRKNYDMEVVHKENNYAGGYDMEVARGDDEDCVQISSDEDGSEGRIHFSEVVPASVISRNDFSEELPSLAPIFSKPQNKKRPRSPLIVRTDIYLLISL